MFAVYLYICTEQNETVKSCKSYLITFVWLLGEAGKKTIYGHTFSLDACEYI